MKFYNFYFLLVASIISCVETPKNDSITEESPANTNIIIQDSLIISSSESPFIIDYNREKGIYLLYDFFAMNILVVGENGNPIVKFNKLGQGPEEYGQIRAIGFLGENKIIIAEGWSYKVYDLKGNFLEGAKFDDGILAEPMFNSAISSYINEDGEQIIGIKGGKYDLDKISTRGFNINSNWVTLLNVNKKNYKSGVNYSKEFYGKKAYPGSKSPIFCINASNKELYAVFPLEHFIYTYDLKDLSLKKKEDTYPDFFSEPIGLSIDKSKDYAALNKIDLENAKYKGIYYLGDGYLLTYYQTSVNASLQNNDRSQMAMMEKEESRKNYLQIFKNGKKVSPDMKIPNNLTFIAAYGLDHIIFEKNEKEDKIEQVYYKTSIF